MHLSKENTVLGRSWAYGGETGEKVEEWIQENAPPESSISFLTPIFLTVHSGHIGSSSYLGMFYPD
jgi:hypothetical protein